MRRQLRCWLWLRRNKLRDATAGDLEAQALHPIPVAGHGEVARMAADQRAQVLALLGNGAVHAPSQRVLDRVQLGPQPLGTGQPQDHERALAALAAAIREAQAAEGLGSVLSASAAVGAREAPELDSPRRGLV